MWLLAVILIVALLIPVAAILVDSPLGRSVARRMEGVSCKVDFNILARYDC